jgi:hypothetical protein
VATARTSGTLKMVTMRDFRNNFQRMEEPVRVVRARGEIEVIGTWTPAKKKPNGTEEPQGES